MKIRVDRESICMGDDVFSHRMDLDIPEDMTVKELCSFLQKDRYLPGLDTEWFLRHGGKTITSYNTETKELTNPNIYLKDLIHQGSRGNDFVWIYRRSY
ncbi:hypothetical protein MK385_06905 [Streptococcus oralis]|uniref:hypothetical protein n=1 Tax=Streptococcus oralis TaxID=1303 RepID=UPI0022853290|nr:hypothetical protein [Streptococcus oralis]MCY7062510.1 hypothetical protein [Streptococcus oralis]